MNMFFFFFSSRRRHTRFKCDWSSDVCSSDLGARNAGLRSVKSAVKAAAVRNADLAGSEVGRIAEDVPAIGIFSGPAEIIPAVPCRPRLGCLNIHDGVDLPAFQHLGKPFDSGNVVSGRESKSMADVEVAARIFGLSIVAVLRQPAEAVQRSVVEPMRS